MIVFPMVGRSSRFFEAGYKRPKYELLLNGDSVFSCAVKSFQKYFSTDLFYFIVRSDFDAKNYVLSEVAKLGILKYLIFEIAGETLGQADTVYQGIRSIADDEELYIFNIDTFRHNFEKPDFSKNCDGYIEVFRGTGTHWSFVEPGNDFSVLRTTEKERISDMCSDGLYFFRKKSDFDRIFEMALEKNATVKGEYYIAPLYNLLIQAGKDIRYHVIHEDRITFCGTPDEYLKIAV